MERGFEALQVPRRSTVVDCIEDKKRHVQETKETFLRTIPPELRANVVDFREVKSFDARLAYLNEALQLLKMYDGTISANRRAIEYFKAFLDQMDATRTELVDLYGTDDLLGMDAVRADIIDILEAYSA